MSSEDIQMITEILSGYTNPNNNIRKAAETKLNDLRENLGAISYCLLSVTSNQALQFILKKTSLVLLRQILIKDWRDKWKTIQPELKAEIKSISLKLLFQEQDMLLKQHCCDVISQLIEIIELTEESWPEIHQMIYHMYTYSYDLSSQASIIQIKALLILLTSSIAFFTDEINKDIDKLFNLVQSIFSSDIIDLKVSCSNMIKEYIITCEDDDYGKFTDFILNIFQFAECLFNKHDESNLNQIMDILIEIAEDQGEYFKPYFKAILSFESLVTKTNEYIYNEKTRESAFELIITIVEQVCSLFQNNIGYLKQFIYDLYDYALDMSRNIPEEWENPKINSNEDAPVISEDRLKFVQETIERVQIELEIECVDIGLECIDSMFNKQTNDWVCKYVGLISLSQIMCYIKQMNSIEKYFPFIYQMLSNPNCKIRYAAAHCIDQISDSFNSHYQNQAGIALIELLIATAFQEKVPIVQSKLIEALATFISFINNADKAFISNSNTIQKLFDFLFQLFSRNDIAVMIRTEILKCNSELIKVIEADCSPYADRVLEILKQYLAHIYQHQINKCLYGILIDNITLIGPYTEDTYTPILPDIINTIIEIIETMKDNINPLRRCIQNSIERIIPMTKNKYPDKIGLIIHSIVILINTAKNNSKKKNNMIKAEKTLLVNADDNDDDNDEDDKEKSDKNYIDPDDLEDLIDIIETLIKAFEENFIPYVIEIETGLIEILQISDDPKLINKICVLFTSIIGIITDLEMKKEQGKKYINLIICAIEREIYGQKTSSLFASMRSIIDNSGVIYTKEETHQIFEKLVQFFDKYNSKRVDLYNKQNENSTNYKEILDLKNITNELNTNGNDNNTKLIVSNKIISNNNQVFKPTFKFLMTEIKNIETIQKEIILSIGTMIKIYKKDSNEIINVCLTKIIPQYIITEDKDKDKSYSSFIHLMMVFLVDDLIEYLGPDYFNEDNWGLLFQILIDAIKFKDYKMIRAVSYGIGLFAKQSSNITFDNVAKSAIQVLSSMNETPNQIKTTKKKRKYILAKDNITAAFGKIIKYQSDSSFIKANLSKMLLYWISNLPIQLEDDEIEEQHELLCNIIINGNYSIIKTQHSKEILHLLLRIFQLKEGSKMIKNKIKEMFYLMKQDKDILIILQGYYDTESNAELKKNLKSLMENA